jgi:hypothetical protein
MPHCSSLVGCDDIGGAAGTWDAASSVDARRMEAVFDGQN